MSNLSLRLALCLSLLLGSCADALACSCSQTTLEEKIRAADYVFMAWTTSAVVSEQGPNQGWMIVRFKDHILYKGTTLPFESVRTPSESAMCGSSVTVPSIYWFFTNSQGEFYSCSGTQPMTTPDGYELSGRVSDKVLELKRRQVRELRARAADGG